jgi:hypothetical protein
MENKSKIISVREQMVFSVIPILNLWSAYRIGKFRRFLLILLLIWVVNVCFISCSLSIFNLSQTIGLCDFGYPLLKKVDSAVEQQNNISPLIFYNYKIYNVWVNCQTLGQHLYFGKILCVLYWVKVKVIAYSHQSNIAIYLVSLPLS